MSGSKFINTWNAKGSIFNCEDGTVKSYSQTITIKKLYENTFSIQIVSDDFTIVLYGFYDKNTCSIISTTNPDKNVNSYSKFFFANHKLYERFSNSDVTKEKRRIGNFTLKKKCKIQNGNLPRIFIHKPIFDSNLVQ
jgi:hypothetical protein